MTKKTMVTATCLLAVGSVVLAAGSGEGRRAARVKARLTARALAPNAPQVVGTIQYDTGVNAGFFPSPGGITVGNRFNDDMGAPLLMTGNVQTFAFFPRVAGNTVYFSVFGPPNTMGTAAPVAFFAVSSVVGNTFNAVTLPPTLVPTVGPDFLAGVFCEAGANDNVGMDNMAAPGQGFHAFQINTMYPGAGTMFQVVANQNAMFRVRGNLLVPVELMNFSVR